MIGYVHNKMIIHSLFVNPHADGKSGEVFRSPQNFSGIQNCTARYLFLNGCIKKAPVRLV